MMVGLVLTDSGTLFDLNYTEFFKDRADDVLQDEKLIQTLTVHLPMLTY
jgi:hypothetical protein